MLLSLILCTALTQSPTTQDRSPVGLVISSKRAGADQISKKFVERLLTVLRKEGVGVLTAEKTLTALKNTGLDDPRTCDGADSCLNKVAVVLGAHAVVIGVDVGKIQKNLAVHVSAMAADSSEPLAVSEFIAKEDKWVEQSSTPLLAFVNELKAKLTFQVPASPTPKEPVTREPPPSDTPTKDPVLTPKPTKEPEPPVVIKDPEPTGKGPLPWVLAGGAVGAIGASVTLGVLGFQNRALYCSARAMNDCNNVMANPELPVEEARRRNALLPTVNTQLTAALITGVAGLALGGVSAWLFVKE